MKNILNRKNLFASQSLTVLVIMLAILVVINLISIAHFGRLDLTEEKQYSLSDATKNTLKKLDDPLFVKVYFSQKLPPDLALVDQYVKDILAEYHSLSGNLQVEFIDPAKDTSTEEEVANLGIPSIEMQMLEKDEFKVQKGYLGIALLYGDKKEIIPVVENTLNLEYDLTSAIKRLTAESLKKVAFLSGHQEHGIVSLPYNDPSQQQTADYTAIREALAKNYQVTAFDSTTGTPISGIDTLIVAGPKTEISAKEAYEIDQFIMNGGRVIFLLDQVQMAAGLQAIPGKTGLEDMLKHYGVQINQDLVIDSINENVGFSSGQMQFYLPYPFWPKLTKDNFDQQNPIMAKLQTISFPWVSSISTTDISGIEIKSLATTSAKSSTVSQPFNLDPQQEFSPTDLRKVPLVIEAKGKFSSFFADTGKPLSEDTKEGKDEVAFSPSSATDSEMLRESKDQSQILIVADSDFIADDYLQRFPQNGVFFLNAVDYLTLDSDLINIRSKSVAERPIKETSDNAKTWIKIINIILIPLLIITLGVVKFYLRKKK